MWSDDPKFVKFPEVLQPFIWSKHFGTTWFVSVQSYLSHLHPPQWCCCYLMIPGDQRQTGLGSNTVALTFVLKTHRRHTYLFYKLKTQASRGHILMLPSSQYRNNRALHVVYGGQWMWIKSINRCQDKIPILFSVLMCHNHPIVATRKSNHSSKPISLIVQSATVSFYIWLFLPMA